MRPQQLPLDRAPRYEDMHLPPHPRFDGSDYIPARDDVRLTGQLLRVFTTMQTGTWRTLAEIARTTGDPHASVSAQLRHLRKPRFGGHTIEKRHRGDPATGLWEYRLTVRSTE